jgi:hypothetical protein
VAYEADNSIVVEAVQRYERVRLDDLDGLAAWIRAWEDASRASGRRAPRDPSDARDLG